METIFKNTESNELEWYAVRTYNFRERVVAQSFETQGIHHFLPLLREKHRWSDRFKTIEVPLFKNYLFVKIAPTRKNFWKVTSTRGVTRILGDEKGPISIPCEEIEAVARMLVNKKQLEVIYGFNNGQPIKIKTGPLAGIEGLFVQFKGKEHLAIYINILGQTVLSEINYCDIESC
jgi:transcription antitermination factor NusG